MKWKIYYADGSTSTDSEPLKPLGVAVILQYNERVGRRVLKYYDWYRLVDDQWFDCSQFDVLFALSRDTKVIALRGQYIPEVDFEKILIAAHNDPDLPSKVPDEPYHEAWQGKAP